MSTGNIIFLNPFAANKSAGNFAASERQTFGDLGERGAIHQIGDVIARVKKNAAEPADGFLRAARIARDRNTVNGRKDSIEVPHDFAHRNFRRIFGENVAAANSRRAFHPALRFEREHDLFEKTFRHIVAPGEFADGNGRATVMFHQREHGAQGVIRLLGNSHRKNDKPG